MKSRNGPCPVCGQRKSWSSPSENPHDPEFVLCYGNSPPLPGWDYVGEAGTGARMYRRSGSSRSFDVDYTPFLPSSSSRIASIEARDRVYRALLRQNPLDGAQKKKIKRRGFAAGDLRDHPLGYLPGNRGRVRMVRKLLQASGLDKSDLRGVPGFFLNKHNQWSLAGPAGLLLPVLDEEGCIQGLQIRPDSPRGNAKYLWLSSAHKENGGTKSGAPAGILLPSTSEGKKSEIDSEIDHLWITEGFFKGLALRKETEEPVLWAAGVGLLQSILEKVERLQPKRVSVLFDADWRSNLRVRKSMVQLAEGLRERGMEVRLLAWPSSYGKGIDDALLLGGMKLDHLEEIDQDRIALSVLGGLDLPHLKIDPRLLAWEPEKQPSEEEIREESRAAILDAFSSPEGTLVVILAGTNSGKTYSTTHEAPPRTLYIHSNYKTLAERYEELRALGRNTGIYYGRQPHPEQYCDSPEGQTAQEQKEQTARMKRWEEAGCPRYPEASRAGAAGHNPCEGCPYFKYHQEPLFHQKPESECRYWPMRERIENVPPPYLLMVPQTLLAHPEILRHYDRVVIDDVPQWIEMLEGETKVTRDDVLDWVRHPLAEQLPEEVRQLFSLLLDGFNHRDLQTANQLQQGAEEALKALRLHLRHKKRKYLECEESFEREGQTVYPLRLVRSLLESLVRGKGYQLTDHRVTYLRPHLKLLKQLRFKVTLVLDATADIDLWRWFGQGYGFDLKVPQLSRRLPQIIQIMDRIYNREQIQKYAPFFQQLIEALGEEETAVFSFKPQEGKPSPFALTGHYGRDERGLNQYQEQGFEQLLALGHFQLSATDAREAAWKLKTFADHLGIAPPEFTYKEEPDEKNRVWRHYHDPLRPSMRRCWQDDDPLVEHLRRHHSSSHVVQLSARLRDLEKPILVFSGEPLDGLFYDVPVQVMTSPELAARYGLSPPEEGRRLSPQLKRSNQQRSQEFQSRLQEALEETQAWIEANETLPGFNQLRKLLAAKKKHLASSQLTRAVYEQIKGLCPLSEATILQENQGDKNDEVSIERGVPDTLLKEEKERVWYTPILSESDSELDLGTQGSEGPQQVDIPPVAPPSFKGGTGDPPPSPPPSPDVSIPLSSDEGGNSQEKPPLGETSQGSFAPSGSVVSPAPLSIGEGEENHPRPEEVSISVRESQPEEAPPQKTDSPILERGPGIWSQQVLQMCLQEQRQKEAQKEPWDWPGAEGLWGEVSELVPEYQDQSGFIAHAKEPPFRYYP